VTGAEAAFESPAHSKDDLWHGRDALSSNKQSVKRATMGLVSQHSVVKTGGLLDSVIGPPADFKEIKNETQANEKEADFKADLAILRAVNKEDWDSIRSLVIPEYLKKNEDGNTPQNKLRKNYGGKPRFLTVAAKMGLNKLIEDLEKLEKKARDAAQSWIEKERIEKKKKGDAYRPAALSSEGVSEAWPPYQQPPTTPQQQPQQDDVRRYVMPTEFPHDTNSSSDPRIYNRPTPRAGGNPHSYEHEENYGGYSHGNVRMPIHCMMSD